jgi:DNA-binding protein H-NS
MRNHDLETMDFEYLWQLREELTKILPEKIMAEKLELERRLAQLVGGESGGAPGAVPAAPSTRKYPKVLPKYRNPSAPGETWSGRGKQPRWVVKALAVGGTLEDFRIGETEQKRKGDHNKSKIRY